MNPDDSRVQNTRYHLVFNSLSLTQKIRKTHRPAAREWKKHLFLRTPTNVRSLGEKHNARFSVIADITDII